VHGALLDSKCVTATYVTVLMTYIAISVITCNIYMLYGHSQDDPENFWDDPEMPRQADEIDYASCCNIILTSCNKIKFGEILFTFQDLTIV
jgi:hypothetical protein